MMKLTREADGTDTVQAFTCDGKLITDVVCPVGCGACCQGWEAVPELGGYLGMGFARCPHLRARGCKLKRSRRPLGCKAYLCELGFLAGREEATPEEIRRTIAAGEQERAFRFLGKSPEAQEGTMDELPSHLGPEWVRYLRLIRQRKNKK